jgi:hypothetical protein
MTPATSVSGAAQVLVLLGAWCALRYGELSRSCDVAMWTSSVGCCPSLTLWCASTAPIWSTGPKSVAGVRDVAIPPQLFPVIQAHLSENRLIRAHHLDGDRALVGVHPDDDAIR